MEDIKFYMGRLLTFIPYLLMRQSLPSSGRKSYQKANVIQEEGQNMHF